MIHRVQILRSVAALALLGGLTGCAHIDRFGTSMDMATNRLSQPGSHIYEGRVESVHRVGAMIAIQFDGGRYYDVVDAPAGLVRGDVVRIYKNEHGLEAHLWVKKLETKT